MAPIDSSFSVYLEKQRRFEEEECRSFMHFFVDYADLRDLKKGLLEPLSSLLTALTSTISQDSAVSPNGNLLIYAYIMDINQCDSFQSGII